MEKNNKLVKTAKKNNPSTKKINPTKIGIAKAAEPERDKDYPNSPWIDEYRDFFTHRMHPVSDAFIRKLSADLIEYAETTEDLLRIEAFFTKKRIPATTCVRWREKFPEFKAAYEAAKSVLGMRREDGALRKGWSTGVVMNTMALYDDEYRKLREWEARLRDQESTGNNITINLPDITKENK
jgi:hypothetical protein